MFSQKFSISAFIKRPVIEQRAPLAVDDPQDCTLFAAKTTPRHQTRLHRERIARSNERLQARLRYSAPLMAGSIFIDSLTREILFTSDIVLLRRDESA